MDEPCDLPEQPIWLRFHLGGNRPFNTVEQGDEIAVPSNTLASRLFMAYSPGRPPIIAYLVAKYNAE
jgi:hypothetical protein